MEVLAVLVVVLLLVAALVLAKKQQDATAGHRTVLRPRRRPIREWPAWQRFVWWW